MKDLCKSFNLAFRGSEDILSRIVTEVGIVTIKIYGGNKVFIVQGYETRLLQIKQQIGIFTRDSVRRNQERAVVKSICEDLVNH